MSRSSLSHSFSLISVSPRLRGGLCFLFLMLLPAFSQDASTGAIRGMVSDASGGRLNAATVVIVNEATSRRFSTASDSDGRYTFELLPPGDYSGRAEYTGMSPQLSPQVHVAVGASLDLD